MELFYTIFSIFDAKLYSLMLLLNKNRIFSEYFIQKTIRFLTARMQNISVIFVWSKKE